MVLKYGGSVLAAESDLGWVAASVAAEESRSQGCGTVVVVSAFGATTDELFERAARQGSGHVEPEHLARLAATGEEGASALFAMALEAAGREPVLLGPRAAGIQTEGELLDATPVALDDGAIRDGLGRTGLVVVPGFVGRHPGDRLSLLGRGGSDLSALFLAAQLGARRCVLLKDVDGLYESDPKESPAALRLETVSLEDAARVAGRAVQPKALEFARAEGLGFELGHPDHAALRTQLVP